MRSIRLAQALMFASILAAQSSKDVAFVGARGRYWAFQKVARPAVPEIRDAWIRNPIDAFILDGLRRKALTPSGPLDRAQLIRRVTYDLTGLPPAPDDVTAFIRDKAPN